MSGKIPQNPATQPTNPDSTRFDKKSSASADWKGLKTTLDDTAESHINKRDSDSAIGSDTGSSISSRTVSKSESVSSADSSGYESDESVPGPELKGLDYEVDTQSPLDQKHELGKGEFGKVYSVRLLNAPRSANTLAFKVAQNGTTLDNEKRIMSVVGEHPNIAKCYGEQTISDQTGLLFEQVSGPQLDVLSEALDNARLPVDEYLNALKYLEQQKFAAVAHLETEGVSHSDLKPSNFLLHQPTKEVKLIDFGQSCLEHEEVNCGHESFASPEGLKTLGGAKGHGVLGKPSIDSYSLGQMIYRTMTGHDNQHGKPFVYNAKIDDIPTSMRGEKAFLVHRAMNEFVKPNADGSYKTVLATDDNAIEEHARMIESGRLKSENLIEIMDSANELKPELVHMTSLINGLMHPKPELRLTAQQAMNHPWFTETPVDPQKAMATLSALNV